MVLGEERPVVVRRGAQEDGAQQRPARQIEGPRRLLADQAAELGFAPRQGEGRGVDQRQRRRGLRRRQDHLHRELAAQGEDRAQRLVPRHDAGERPRQGGPVEIARQAHRRRHVVDRRAGHQLVDEPEPLLGEGERRLRAGALGRRHRLEDRRGLARGGGRERRRAGGLDDRRQPGDRRRLEEGANRQVDFEGLADAAEDPRHQERMAAEVEEIVVDADRLAPERLAPDGGEQLLDRRARRG